MYYTVVDKKVVSFPDPLYDKRTCLSYGGSGNKTNKKAEEWLCVEQSRELFSDIRGRGGASNACLHS